MSRDRQDRWAELLSSYLDGEVTEAERGEVERLLREDPAARKLLQELKATVSAVQNLPRGRASADLMAGMRARLERQALLGGPGEEAAVGSGGWLPRTRALATAAVIVLTVFAGYVIWDVNRPGTAGGGERLSESRPPAAPPALAMGESASQDSPRKSSDEPPSAQQFAASASGELNAKATPTVEPAEGITGSSLADAPREGGQAKAVREQSTGTAPAVAEAKADKVEDMSGQHLPIAAAVGVELPPGSTAGEHPAAVGGRSQSDRPAVAAAMSTPPGPGTEVSGEEEAATGPGEAPPAGNRRNLAWLVRRREAERAALTEELNTSNAAAVVPAEGHHVSSGETLLFPPAERARDAVEGLPAATQPAATRPGGQAATSPATGGPVSTAPAASEAAETSPADGRTTLPGP